MTFSLAFPGLLMDHPWPSLRRVLRLLKAELAALATIEARHLNAAPAVASTATPAAAPPPTVTPAAAAPAEEARRWREEARRWRELVTCRLDEKARWLRLEPSTAFSPTSH